MTEWLHSVTGHTCFLPCAVALVLVVGAIAYFFATGGAIRFWFNGDDDGEP